MPTNLPVIIGNRYRLHTHLGQGGFGVVYQATDLYLDIEVAIKVLHKIPSPGPWQEAQLMVDLEGDFILPVRNADQDAGVPYIVTELALNGAVEGHIGHGVPVPQAIEWAKQAASGAQRCHDQQLIHRDIKPDNLFIDCHGRAQLGDFGLAWALTRGGAPPAGSPAFLPSEVAAGASMDIRTDVYSLGACLFNMLAGRPPYQFPASVTTWAQAMAFVAVNPPEQVRVAAPHVPLSLHRVVERAMAADPDNRFQRAVEMDEALGGLDLLRRVWTPTPPHPVHEACWQGRGSNLSSLDVCVSSDGPRFDIEVRASATGRRRTAYCRTGVKEAELPSRLRSLFRDLSR